MTPAQRSPSSTADRAAWSHTLGRWAARRPQYWNSPVEAPPDNRSEPERQRPTRRSLVVLAILAALTLTVTACGGPHVYHSLSPAVRGPVGSRPWCSGVEQTLTSLGDLGSGESYRVASARVHKDVLRIDSVIVALHRPPRPALRALRASERDGGLAGAELKARHAAGFTEAKKAASKLTLGLTRLEAAGVAKC